MLKISMLSIKQQRKCENRNCIKNLREKIDKNKENRIIKAKLTSI